MEYPPYFAYLILLALSGRKNGLNAFLKNVGLVKEGPAFVDEFTRSPIFLNSL